MRDRKASNTSELKHGQKYRLAGTGTHVQQLHTRSDKGHGFNTEGKGGDKRHLTGGSNQDTQERRQTGRQTGRQKYKKQK